MDLAARVDRIEPSATVAISNKASELEEEGVDVVDLSVGDIVDFDTPENVKSAAKDALDAGHTGYTPSSGIPALKSTIVDKLHEPEVRQMSSRDRATHLGVHPFFIDDSERHARTFSSEERSPRLLVRERSIFTSTA